MIPNSNKTITIFNLVEQLGDNGKISKHYNGTVLNNCSISELKQVKSDNNDDVASNSVIVRINARDSYVNADEYAKLDDKSGKFTIQLNDIVFLKALEFDNSLSLEDIESLKDDNAFIYVNECKISDDYSTPINHYRIKG